MDAVLGQHTVFGGLGQKDHAALFIPLRITLLPPQLGMRYWFLAAINAALAILFAAVILSNPFASTIVLWQVAAVSLIVEAVFDVAVLIMTGIERKIM